MRYYIHPEDRKPSIAKDTLTRGGRSAHLREDIAYPVRAVHARIEADARHTSWLRGARVTGGIVVADVHQAQELVLVERILRERVRVSESESE